MTAHLDALSFNANEPARLARFWAEVLGRELTDDLVLPPGDDSGLRVRFRPSDAVKARANRMHLDLTSTSLADQQATVDRAIGAGARHIDVGQKPEEGHIVLADPEGNEFCVIEPGNNFLAGTGFVGCVAGDGTQALGYFWSAALGWPLVWDEDEETAIQSPRGGTKISWGGPPVNPPSGREPHFELLASPAEVDRLITLGATRLDGDRLADPDGNSFLVPAGR